MQSITRLFDFPYYQLEKYNLAESLVTKYKGQWVATSTKEYIEKANAVSRALLRDTNRKSTNWLRDVGSAPAVCHHFGRAAQ